MNNILIAFLLVAVALAVIVSAILAKLGKNTKVFNFVAFLLIFCYAFALFFVISTEWQGNVWTTYVLSASPLVLLAVLTLVFGKRAQFDTYSVCAGAVCVALSFALSFVKWHVLGASVTLASMFPLMLYAYVFGLRRGVTCAVVYGFLQFVQGPYVLHYVQVLLDYPVAFGFVGFAGILRETGAFKSKPTLQFLLGGLVAVVLRYVCHVISGYVFWREDGLTNVGAFTFSLVANVAVLADFVLVAVVSCICFSSKSFKKFLAER